MGVDNDSQLLDLIYGAAVDADLWVPVMERFADRIGGTSAWLSQLSLTDGAGPGVIARIDPVMPARYIDHFADRNPLVIVEDPKTYVDTWSLRILTDEDWMTKEALVRTEYYNDFMRPQDVHSTLMIRLALRDGDVCAISVNRPETSGQFTRADQDVAARFHPHLVRAFNLGRKFADLEFRTAGMIAALDRSRDGVFVLDEAGRVRHVNGTGERLIQAGVGLDLVGGRLTATRADASRRLNALIGAAGSSDVAVRTGGSMTLACPDRRLPLTVTVSPLRAERPFGPGPQTAVMVCISDPNIGQTLSEARLRVLFGLTPAEARVAQALFRGASPRETAQNLGLSFHTVRNQLRAIFEKTGATRQTDLLRLLISAVEPE